MADENELKKRIIKEYMAVRADLPKARARNDRYAVVQLEAIQRVLVYLLHGEDKSPAEVRVIHEEEKIILN